MTNAHIISPQPLITAAQLVCLYGCTLARAEWFAPWLDEAMQEHAINTPARITAFLAQIGHESGRLRYTREIWGPTPAQLRYEARADLGNTAPGDGKRYLGRGLIQLTGRANYGQMSAWLGEDFLAFPQLLETPKWASRSAAKFWESRGLNELADREQFSLITRRINGGQNGQADRLALHQRAQTLIA